MIEEAGKRQSFVGWEMTNDEFEEVRDKLKWNKVTKTSIFVRILLVIHAHEYIL